MDGCESNIFRAYQVNSFGPHNIAHCYGGKLVHISTDYVFGGQGKGTGLYQEYDPPDPCNKYGNSKLVGEIGLTQVNNALIIRTTVLYNYNSSNFVKTVYDKLKNGARVTAPELFCTPTHTHHLALGILDAIKKDLSGIIHLVGTTYISRYEMAKQIALKFDYDSNLVSKGPSWGDAHRPMYLGLNTDLAKKLDLPLFSFEQGLEKFKEEINADINK